MSSTVAIVGRPNVGKSTLFNRIVGRKTAIVDDEPGVTRDRIISTAEWNNHTITLVDTGGLVPTGKRGLIALIQAQTKRAIQEADAIICVFDGREGFVAADAEIVRMLRKANKPVFFAVNKIDTKRLEELVRDFYPLGTQSLFPISAESGTGVIELMEEVIKELHMEEPGQQAVKGVEKPFARVSIVGRPNVGKSTLLNRLLGDERALVDEAPGTTRDSLDTLMQNGGRTYLLIDTAGIRRKSRVKRGAEFYSVRRAFQAIGRSDISLLLIDAIEGPTSQDLRLLSHIFSERKACALIVNKWDALKGSRTNQKEIVSFLRRKHRILPYIPILFISALTGEGVQELFPTIERIIEEYRKRITTSVLNTAIENAVKASPPPSSRGRRVRFYYSTQISSAPPNLVVFTNYPEAIPESYCRYLEASLRKKFLFTGTPLVLLFKRKK